MVKLCLLPAGHVSALTEAERAYLEAALHVFFSQVENKLPGAQHRDGMQESLQHLRTLLVTFFSPETNHITKE
jgi:hypothetical protein